MYARTPVLDVVALGVPKSVAGRGFSVMSYKLAEEMQCACSLQPAVCARGA